MTIGRGGLVVSSPSAPASSVILFGANDVDFTTLTRFLWPFFTLAGASSGASDVQYAIPINCKLDNLYIKQGSSSANGNPIVYTVRKNSVNTTLAVSIPSNVIVPVANLIDSVSFVAGDLIDVQVTKALSILNTPSHIYATMRLTPL